MKYADLIIVKRERRQKRVRSKVHGTAERPRLAIYRSNKHVFLQAIDDDAAKTLVGKSDKGLKGENKTKRAEATATAVADALAKMGVTKLVFDRRHYRYHGRVKAVAEAMRAAKMEF